MKVKVRANAGFERIKDAERSTKDKAVYFIEGDIWEVEQERAEFLQDKGVVEIIKVTPQKVTLQKVIESAKDDKEFINPIKEELKEVKIERETLPEVKVEEVIKPKKKKSKK